MLAPAIAFVVAFGLLAWMVRRPPAWLPMDTPNARSLHRRPVPRAGGLALLAGALAAWLFAGAAGSAWCAIALGLAAVSWLDDRRGLPAAARLAAHLAAAALFLWLAGGADDWLPWAGVALAIAWMTNLYNFMDGSDGLAGGMALFGFGCYGVAAAQGGNPVLAQACFSMAAAAAAFLCFNFHPARIFMGDVASIPLGFLAAALGFQGWREGLWPAWFPLLVFSPFVADASVTLARRLLRGEKIWRAHREHYYQRLVQAGFGHRGTALLEYVLMLGAGAAALWGLRQDSAAQAGMLLAAAAVYAGLMALADFHCRRHSRKADSEGRREGWK